MKSLYFGLKFQFSPTIDCFHLIVGFLIEEREGEKVRVKVRVKERESESSFDDPLSPSVAPNLFLTLVY
jgi:hypothetical protein